MANPLIDIIIVTKNQIEYTKKCIESIVANAPRPIHLILIENASDDGTVNYFKELQNKEIPGIKISVIFNRENVGYVCGVNQGLTISKAGYVVLSNNDIVVYPGAIEEMVRIADSKPEIGLVNPNSNEFGLEKFEEKILQKQAGAYRERCHASGFFMLIKRAVINAIGIYDSVFSPGYFEEMDYSERAKHAGFIPVIANAAYVYHFGSRSFTPSLKKPAWDKNRAIFIEKWGGTKWFAFLGTPAFFGNTNLRLKSIEKLTQIARKNIAVLFLFLPLGTGKYFENIHDSFRIIEIPFGLTFLAFCLRVIYPNKKKPISKAYLVNSWPMKWIQPIFRRRNLTVENI